MANTIQMRRGANASLPVLNAGEFGFSTDTKQIYIGDGAANHELVRAKLASVLELNEKTILIDAALSSDHTWTGPTQTITAGENLAQFEVAYLKSDGLGPGPTARAFSVLLPARPDALPPDGRFSVRCQARSRRPARYGMPFHSRPTTRS